MEQIIQEGLKALGLPAPEEQIRTLARYGQALARANAVTNLTAITEPDQVARLHFLDSAALLTAADFSGARVADVGCGAGFPGLVLRILKPDIRLTLLDSAGKKIEFCQSVCQELALPDVRCLWGRAEELPELRESFDVVVSRAVAELDVLAELCLPLTAVGGRFLAMKGPDCGAETAEAEFAVRALGGRVADVRRYTLPGTEIVHAVVVIEKLKKTPAQYPRRYAQIKKRPLRP